VRVLFYGSIPKDFPYCEQLKSNLTLLIKEMISNDYKFLIRNPKITNMETIPIDHIIYDIIKQHYKNIRKEDLIVISENLENGHFEIDLPHTHYYFETEHRVYFYNDLLSKCDIVISVGGELGVTRIAISCEWVKHPMLPLAGSGGASETLWRDFFTKSIHAFFCSEEEKKKIKEVSPIISKYFNPKSILEAIRILRDKKNNNLEQKNNPIKETLITSNYFDETSSFDILKKLSGKVVWTIFSIAVFIFFIGFLIGQGVSGGEITKWIIEKTVNKS